MRPSISQRTDHQAGLMELELQTYGLGKYSVAKYNAASSWAWGAASVNVVECRSANGDDKDLMPLVS